LRLLGRLAAGIMTIMQTDTSKALTPEELRSKVREGSQVLWVYRGNVEDGNVVIRAGDRLCLCWLDGHSSRNDDVMVDEVLAVFDKRARETVEIFPFSGRGHMTVAGQQWLKDHPAKESGT